MTSTSKGWVVFSVPTGGVASKEFAIDFGNHLQSLGKHFVIGDYPEHKHSNHHTIEVFIKID